MAAHDIPAVQHDHVLSSSAMAARQPVCLVLMPMYAGFEGIRAHVARILERVGLEMRRLEAEIADSAWHHWLLESALAPDMVLVDLTHNNPFVMYELGYVHYRKFPTLFIMNASEQRIPAIARGSVCSVYGDGHEHFEDDLVEHLRLLVGTCLNVPGDDHRRRPKMTAGLYEIATAALDELDAAIGHRLPRVDEQEFWLRLEISRRRGAPDPACLSGRMQHRYLMTLLVSESDRVRVMETICDWSFGRIPTPSTRD